MSIFVGAQYGLWTIIKRSTRRNKGCWYWWCRCACGHESEVNAQVLQNGRSTRCQACAKTFIDHTGQQIGEWDVIERSEKTNTKGYRVYWKCRCVCGDIHDVNGSLLRSGQSTCCAKCSRKKCVTHGYARTRTYVSWKSMKQRCYNPNCISFKKYGAKGIGICGKWRNSFAAFVADMGPRPLGTSIDRIDGTKDYQPGNCRWDSTANQNRNTTTSKLTREKVLEILAADETITNVALAKQFKVSKSTIQGVKSGKAWPEVFQEWLATRKPTE